MNKTIILTVILTLLTVCGNVYGKSTETYKKAVVDITRFYKMNNMIFYQESLKNEKIMKAIKKCHDGRDKNCKRYGI